MDLYNRPNLTKGILYIIAGTLLLLNTLGVLQRGVTLLLVIVSLVIMGVGAMYLNNELGFLPWKPVVKKGKK
ncbi:MAG: hypothetical protein UU47_C0013G0004 [candidate division TM6 bacterium GW2011_GWE2_41_16]|nr:MAG: hypothetical protein UU47_C0013G0004 [candidate division TM6 bacterium GW2011_GWE2_41_16]